MKRLLSIILILATFCFFTPFAYATSGITFDTSGKASEVGGTATLSYTVGAGTGAIMIISASCPASESLCVLSAPTYNGVTATEIGEIDDNNLTYEEMWYINNPTQGSAHNVAMTNSGGSGLTMFVSTYLGSAGIIGSGNSTVSTNSGVSSVTLTLTTQKDNSWTVSGISGGSNNGTAGGTGTTARQTGSGGGGAGAGGIGDSNAPIHPKGSTSMQWTFTSGNYSAIMAEIPPIQTSFAFYQFMDF